MRIFFERIEQWLEAPQVVLDGTEVLIIIGLLLIVFCWPRRDK